MHLGYSPHHQPAWRQQDTQLYIYIIYFARNKKTATVVVSTSVISILMGGPFFDGFHICMWHGAVVVEEGVWWRQPAVSFSRSLRTALYSQSLAIGWVAIWNMPVSNIEHTHTRRPTLKEKVEKQRSGQHPSIRMYRERACVHCSTALWEKKTESRENEITQCSMVSY